MNNTAPKNIEAHEIHLGGVIVFAGPNCPMFATWFNGPADEYPAGRAGTAPPENAERLLPGKKD